MKLHLPCRLRRAVVRALFAAATVVTTLASSTYADMITPDGRTATQVIQSGNVYDVYTNTVRGNTGFNSFSTFDVYADTTANLHLADGTGKLINVVRDSSSHIDGVLNSYKDGSIGGDVYFLNPHGIIVGKSGVINVGSISMSTPTAAFVEQLIARDGSISPTATQAVLAGDMPINEKGTISIKGKVNSARTAEIRAGKAEVKGGEINARVKLSEMVNTGGRKVDTQGMSIQDGKLSFGATPAKESKAAEPVVEPEAEPEEEATSRMADISIFADNVLVDGGFLNADSVYIDPDVASLINTAISGEYTAEARVITINNVSVKEGEKLTSFTLCGNNALEAGDVSITISNSNIVADEVSISATATSNAAEAIVSITASTLGADPETGSLTIYANSESGNSRVDIQRSAISAGNGVDAAAMSVQGHAALTLDAASSVTADVVSLAAAASTGNADVSVQGKVSGDSEVTLTAATGAAVSNYAAGQDISKTEFTPEGGGNATVTVGGTVESGGSISVGAYTTGTYGDATVDISGSLSATATETKQIGELGLDRTEAETANETDSEDQVNAKNAAYLDRYVKYLKTLQTAEGATGTIAVEAASISGKASFSQAASSQLTSSLSASISADAAEAASVTLAGKITSGNISVTATGDTSTLSTVQRSALMVGPHQYFMQDGTVVSLEKANGSITLEAGTHDDDNPDAPAPAKGNGVLLEVAGILAAQRGKADGAGDGGDISLISAGKLTVAGTAAVGAVSPSGKGGTIYLDAPEYEILAAPSRFVVTGSEQGSILLMSYEEVTGDNINNLDDMSASFLNGTFNPTKSNSGGAPKLFAANSSTDQFKDWDVGYHRVSLSGKISLNKDIDVSLSTTAIADNTEIKGNGYSLTLHNNFSHQFNFGALITIGKNVKITGVKNFTLNWNHEGYMEALLSTYLGSPTRLTVGDNFTVEASGKVAITLAGMYNTYIAFGKGVNIQADGEVTLSAKTWNGMGTSLFSSSNTNILAKVIALIPDASDSPGGKAVANTRLLTFDTDKFVELILEKWQCDGKKSQQDHLFFPQIGVRVSRASVTFADNGYKTDEDGNFVYNEKGELVNGGSITGANVTISAASNASVAGRKVSENDWVGLSIGAVSNGCEVDLGNRLTITANGTGDKEGNVSITSKTKSKASLENVYTSHNDKYAIGVLFSFCEDDSELVINDEVKINATKDITIASESTVETKPFMTLGEAVQKKLTNEEIQREKERAGGLLRPEIGDGDDEDQGENYDEQVIEKEGKASAGASNLVMVGVNVLKHTNTATVSGTLTSTSGNIIMKSEDNIKSSLTMNGSLRYTLGKVKESKNSVDKDWGPFLGELFKDCFRIDLLGGGTISLENFSFKGLEFTPGFNIDYLKTEASEAQKTFKDLEDFQNKQDTVGHCLDIALASDVVLTDNTFTFNGEAHADSKNGSVTLGATSSIAAACGAETSIVGVPTKYAWAGSLAVPVVLASTTMDVGRTARITAGKDINVSSKTDLPLLFDPLGWRGWADAAHAQASDKAAGFISAARGSLTYLKDYVNNGDFGLLDSCTSSHASTFMRNTGADNTETMTAGGDIVADVRHLKTKTIINGGAVLIAGANLEVDSTTTGTQATIAGKLPWFFSLDKPSYWSTKQATSSFGLAAIVGEKAINTVTYIGAATLQANKLAVNAKSGVFMLELSAAAAVACSGNAGQGSVNVIVEDKMTVSEISGGATITLTGDAATESTVSAKDDGVLVNISGMLEWGKGVAIGAGVAVTVNTAFTAAMLGNNLPISSSYESNWKSMWGDSTVSFDCSDPITLNFSGQGNLKVEAYDHSFLLDLGIAGAVQTKGSEEGGSSPTAAGAANVGVFINNSETTARQNNVSATSVTLEGERAGTKKGGNKITTWAHEKSTVFSMAGDPALNLTGEKDYFIGAGALSLNFGKMDTTAYVTDFVYTPTQEKVIDPKTGQTVFTDTALGDFTVKAENTATAIAADVAVGFGAAAANIAAGVSVNQLRGNTGSYLTGGSVVAGKVDVTALTDLTSFAFTLGAAISITPNARGEDENINQEQVANNIQENIELNQNVEEQVEQILQNRENEDQKDDNNNVAGGGGNHNIVNEPDEEIILNKPEQDDFLFENGQSGRMDSFPAMASDGPTFDLGASIAYNKMDMRSSAIVEGCSITSSGALNVTAEDKSVITAISVGAAAAHSDGTSIAAGGVFSFAPIGSITEAIIRQKSDVNDKLMIKAGSLTLTATDNHRERLWSFGGGYGDSAGLGLVLSWGSYAGATTMTLMEKVAAEIQKTAKIEATSELESFYLSVGASLSTGVLSLTGMFNYMNFNNHVVTDIKNSTLTIKDTKAGSLTVQACGKRTFTDGVGALDIRIGEDKIGAGIGAAVSLVYVGGYGADGSSSTQLLVSGSTINNAGTTKLLAESHTKGLVAAANVGVSVSLGAGGIAANGSVGLLNDASLTQVDVKETTINAYAAGDVYGNVSVEATSDCALTLGMGTLGLQIGEGAGIGASVGLLKDNAATMATMTASRVNGAKNFSLLANGKTDLAGIVLGGGGSGTIGLAGAAMTGTIAHTVVAKLAESIMDVKQKLTVKAENSSNVGTDEKTAKAGGSKGPRFTVVNGALGLFGGGAGADVSIIDVADVVQANAHNVKVLAGEMEVLANEHSYADAVTVSVAGGEFAGVEVNVVLPVLRGAAEASITADENSAIAQVEDGRRCITTTGNLSVKATNNQWIRSHLWTLALAVNPVPFPVGPDGKPPVALAANVCVNSINMAGSSDARIEGPLTLNVGGNLAITADTDRYATYTTVPVSVAVAIFSAAINVDVNSMRVSNDTSPLTEDQDTIRNQGMIAIDEEIQQLATLVNQANVKVGKDAQLTLSNDVGNAMKDAVNSVSTIEAPKTSAVLDLAETASFVEDDSPVAGIATVGGSVTIRAKDKVISTPTTVNVTGGTLAIAPHITHTTVDSTVETIVKDTELTANGDISIDAKQEHGDTFLNVGVAVAAVGVTAAVYNWKDTANEHTKLLGETALTSTYGSISVGTNSDIKETFHHEDFTVGLGASFLFFFPTFTQNEENTLDIASGVSITAGKNVTIGTRSSSKLNVLTNDLTAGFVAVGAGKSGVSLKTTQNLTTGADVTIKGGSVAIRQDAVRDIQYVTSHVSAGIFSFSFPFVTMTDTVDATLSIGNGNQITATSGALSIETDVKANAILRFYGVNEGALGLGVAANSFTETITNNVELKDNVKLRAKDSTVRAKSTHTGDLKGNNVAGNLVGGDILNTYNNADVTSTVTIGKGFEATGVLGAKDKPTTGHSLTLEAINTDKFYCRAEKVTISLVMAPYSRNAFNTTGNSTATITLAGGNIDVENFTAKATTDVSVLVQQRLGGGSIIENTNTGKASNTISQTSTVTLGTTDEQTKEDNKLEITADNVRVNAHNKYLFDRLDKTGNTMVAGKAVGLVVCITDAHVDALQTETATVTLGSGAEIKRRIDTAHYLNRNNYKTLISATNNVESEASLDLLGGGLLSNMALQTKDWTTANATLNLNGSIDTWGDTELTAYSHVRHIMRNTAEVGGIPLNTDNTSYPINIINTTDTVNINKSVESIGNITIQSGSTKGEYRLLDGAVVLAGDDDTNSTNFNYGKKHAVIRNERDEIVNICGNAAVRAGGELAIYNDSSANTAKKVFDQKYTSADYFTAAVDTAASVKSEVTVGADAKLYAGLGSAIMMKFQKGGSDNEAALQLTTAQQLFAEQVKVGDLWQMDVTSGSAQGPLGALFCVVPAAVTGGKPVLGISELTLPGMAFRIVSKAENLERFKGTLYSPAKHGLDIFIAADWTGDVETSGVTLQGHETGLIFNRTPLDAANFTINPCAGPNLYLPEGVAVRSQAQGDLTMSGAYRFPYSTFLATSDHNLTITGQISCGNTVFEAGGNFTVKTDSDYSLRSALSMYEKLFEEWEKRIPGMVEARAQGVVSNSGAGETHDNQGVYKANAQGFSDTYDKDKTIIPAVTKAIGDKEAIVNAMGTVTITANVVDLNGKICSGLLNREIVINDGFHVLTNDGKSITVADAQEIYNGGNGSQTVFKLDGYTGVSLVYDAKENQIFLNSYESLGAGIFITGKNIVNSNPTGSSGLYVAGPSRSLDVTNNSRYTLNVGNVDLMKNAGTSGITLNNEGTGVVTKYELKDGQWFQTVGDKAPTVVGSTATYDTNSGMSNMQVKLEKGLKIGITENGRLTFGGSIGNVDKEFKEYRFKETEKAGLIGKPGNEKETIIDRITVNTQFVQPTKELAASYVAYSDNHKNGSAHSIHKLTEKKISTIYDGGTAYRWHYALDYDELITAELYVSAANSVAVNLGGAGSGGLSIVSKTGDINFTGKVNALSCTVNAAGAITATGGAFISGNSISMTAINGGIGGNVVDGKKVALAFNATEAAFIAGGDIYLTHASDGEIGKLLLNAGEAAELHSGGSIKALDLTARVSATIAAQGQINVTAGYIGSATSAYPARISLSSAKGGISVGGGDFTRGIFTVEAEGNVSINSPHTGDLTLDYVGSRNGNVDIDANGNILTVRGTDMSNPDPSFEMPLEDLAENYYQQMLDYETKYYAKDANGKYANRTEDGILALPEKEKEETMKSLADAFTSLYNSGRGDELGDIMLYLSGTDAVGKTEFKGTADALTYLAQHADKLGTDFVRACYDKMMVDITNEVRLMHGPEKDINYGQFDEAVYRLYWLTDCNGKPVHRDGSGNFISPLQDGTGEAIYTPEMCAAITKQFRGQAARGGDVPYRVEDSALFKAIAGSASGSQADVRQVGKMEDGLGALVGGQAIGEMQATVSAKKGTVSLTANNGQGDIGGGTFLFTIKPIKDEKVDGKFVYSNWAQTFIDSAEKTIWPGIGDVSVNEATGEYKITLAFIEFSESGFNKLNDAFMKRALPMDVKFVPGIGLYRVFLRNYVGVDAQTIKAKGKSVLLAASGNVTLGNGDISAENLFLSATGTLNGAAENTRAGFFNLYADEGIGSAGNSFRISGDSTFTLGSPGDVYVKPTAQNIKVDSITGKRVVVDNSSGSLLPIPRSSLQPNIIGQRIDFYGNLDTGLSFRTTGTSQEEGGLHWYGGSSDTLEFNALNTAYTFWFVREDGAPNPGQVDIGYSGHLYIVNLAGANVRPLLRASAKSGGAPALAVPPAMGGGSGAITANFHQINAKGGRNVLEFEGDQTFGSLSLDGEGAYTVMSSGELRLGSSLSVGGNATLSFAGLGSTQGDAVGISSTGNLALAGCEVKSDLVVNGTGNVSLADVRLAGEASIAGDTVSLNGTSGSERLVLNGSNGVTGTGVSSSQIVANSSNAGVFLNSTSTNSLSGSSHKSFVASVQALDGTAGVTVGNVSADGTTSKVIIQAITDQLVLDGYISGAALEFYSTGVIDEETGAMLLSLYPFWDVWQSEDPEVWNLAIETLESDLLEGYIWLVEEVESLAEKSCDSVDELRRKVNAGGQPHSAAPLRFTDGKGNTVSRDQFANLITSK